jgi:hypothetical protein
LNVFVGLVSLMQEVSAESLTIAGMDWHLVLYNESVLVQSPWGISTQGVSWHCYFQLNWPIFVTYVSPEMLIFVWTLDRTTAEPAIYFMPAKPSEETDKLLQESQQVHC